MKRLLIWLLSRIAPHASPQVIDLPAEYGPRMRVNEVHGIFLDPRNREVINAVAQLLWMHRTAAQERALNAAAMGLPTVNVCLGEIENVNNTMASFQHLMAESLEDRGQRVEWQPTDRMREWFCAEEM